MSEAIRILVHGAGGRMGRAVTRGVHADPGLRLAAAVEWGGSSLIGVDAGELSGVGPLDVAVSADLAAALSDSDVVVDFTGQAGIGSLLDGLEQTPRPLVTGSTGLDAEQLSRLEAYAAEQPVVRAANFSIGVNLCIKLSELAARVLGEGADVEIIEAHHKHKVDAPSGTALRLGEAVAGARDQSLSDCAVYTRDGQTGPRPDGAIGFATVRAGEIVGEHTVMFAAPGERVEITHRAASRENFANGALLAARWVAGQEPGLYDMPDVLGLN